MTDLPQTIGRYTISARLVGTSIDDVFRGFDPIIERAVVVKAFRLNLVDAEQQSAIKQAFYADMQRVGLLLHHGIAQLFDAGEQAGTLFMATEFVEGVSLANQMTAGLGAWDLSARASVIAQSLDALDFAGQLGVPHLNLKPSSIVVGPGRTVKVGGFGVGPFVIKLVAASKLAVVKPSRWAAPELVTGGSGDLRSDVYSAGQIAGELFLGSDAPAMIEAVTAQGGSIDELNDVIARATSASPADRFDSPDAFKQSLLAALGVVEALLWFDDSPSTLTTEAPTHTHARHEAPPEAETMVTPSGTFVLNDGKAAPASPSKRPAVPDDYSGDAPTMMHPTKPQKP